MTTLDDVIAEQLILGGVLILVIILATWRIDMILEEVRRLAKKADPPQGGKKGE